MDKAGGASAVSTNLNREFEMARREAVSFLNHRDQRVELRKMKENQESAVFEGQKNILKYFSNILKPQTKRPG